MIKASILALILALEWILCLFSKQRARERGIKKRDHREQQLSYYECTKEESECCFLRPLSLTLPLKGGGDRIREGERG